MTFAQLKAYAALLGLSWHLSTHDSGQTLTVGGVRLSYEWGEEAEFEYRVLRHLNNQPRPREDDPRTAHEGVYA